MLEQPIEGAENEAALHTRLVSWFEDAEMTTQQAREWSERDRDFYDGFQYTDAELKELAARRQPAIVANRVRRKVEYLAGLHKQSQQDPRAFPRTPRDEGAAEAATDALRYVDDDQRFKQIAHEVWENKLIEGAGGVDVCVKPGGPTRFRIEIKRVPWDRMFWDPHSSRRDFSDARYLGVVLWMDEADALANPDWPNAREVIENTYDSEGDTYDDKPEGGLWSHSKRKRVRVLQIYWRDGDGWHYAALTKGGFLDEPRPSPYVDEQGKPCCPLIFTSAYVARQNERYGVVRDMIDPQREINKRRSKALHLLSVRQIIYEKGAVDSVDVARREAAKPDGAIEVNPGFRFEFGETSDLASGQAQLLQEAKLELDGMGPNATMQGKQADSTASGRAIALSQQGGLVEIGMLLDAHRDWKRRVYEAVWQRIRQFWTEETWVRVTDDENHPRFVGLNVPQMAIDPMTGQPVMQVANAVAEATVDIIIDESPDVVTLQIEQQQLITELVRAAPQLAPALVEPLIRTTNLRNKDKLIERVNAILGMASPDGQADPAAVAQQQQQAMAAEMQAKQAETQMRLEADMAKAAKQAEVEQMKIAAQQEAERQRIAAENMRKAAELEMQWQIAMLNTQAKAADSEAARAMDRERMSAEEARRQQAEATKPDQGAELAATLSAMMGRLDEMLAEARAPREIVRGPDGRAVGVRVGNTVRQIARGPDGKATGLN